MFVMRTSERSSLKKCPQQWYWSQVDGLRPLRDANPLWFGSAVHEALAQWYQPGLARGVHPAEFFENYLGEADRQMRVTNDDEEAEYISAKALGIEMLNNYVDFYGQDERWNVIATEEKLSADFKHPATGKKWFRYVMTWDGIYRDADTGECWLMEHKTAAALGQLFLPLDDQAGSYWALATPLLRRRGILGPKEELAGIMYNFLRKQKKDVRPVNAQGLATNKPEKKHYLAALSEISGMSVSAKDKVEDLAALAQKAGLTVLGEVSKIQPAALFERTPVYRSRSQRATMLQRIRDEASFAEAYRAGTLPVVKAPGRDCSWCPFVKMCQLHEAGEDWESFRDTEFRKTDPYAVYEDQVKST